MGTTKRIHVLCYPKGSVPSKETAPVKQFRTAGRGGLKSLVEGIEEVYELVFFASVGAGSKLIDWETLWEKTPLSLEEAYEFF